MKSTTALLALIGLSSLALGRDVPTNVQCFYDRIKSGKCTGGEVLKDGFYSQQGGLKSEPLSAHVQANGDIC